MSIGIIKVKDTDKIIFQTKNKKKQPKLLKILGKAKGIWKEHPIFNKKNTNQIIEYLRGKDNEV